MLAASRLICTLCAIMFASVALPGCGDGASSSIVARVAGTAISAANLERWTAIEAALAYHTDPNSAAPVPRGVIPDPPAYKGCIAFLAANPEPGQKEAESTRQLKEQCSQKRTRLQRHILDILLVSRWLRGEAAERGVKLTNGEVENVLHGIFPNQGAFHKYLSITGEQPSDERSIIEKDLLDTKLLQIQEQQMKREGLVSGRQHEQALIRVATEFTTKWAARTWCRSDYVVSECRQYQGERSLVAP
jgi:hypothetical protein